jgi:hypothetical protein
VALTCATLVAGVAVAARIGDAASGQMETTVIKSGKPVTAAAAEERTIR